MRTRKLLSLLLALVLCVSLLPAALAEEPVGVIAPAEESEENVGTITPADPEAAPEKTGWAVPLWDIPEADEINETKHTIDVPDVKLEDLTDESVYNAMMAMQTDFPEGMPWTDDDYYDWNGQTNYRGYGCAGFAFLLSDAAFGKLPARMKQVDYDTLRPGDILRINSNTHSVIILQVFTDHVVVAEGNYNSSIHWGRTLSRSKVESSDYVFTRWEGPVDLESCSISVTIAPTTLHYDEDFTMIATVKDKDGKAVGGEVVYFAIQNELGQFVSTRPLNENYDLLGVATNSKGQAVFPFSFHEADGRIVPGKYLVYAKLSDPWQESLPSATAPFTFLGDAVGTIVLSDAQTRPGEEFTLSVDLTDNPGIFALRFHVDYDISLLRFLGVEDGSLTGWGVDTETGMLLWLCASEGDKSDTEGIVKLRFQVLEDAADCETTVSFDSIEANNYAAEDLKFDLTPANIVIKPAIPGDVNRDGERNILDLVRLRKYLLNSATPINRTNADLDGDGSVALRDLVLLRKLLAGVTD